ncbi:MAG: hypothetical protein V1857_01845 [archaeon]
MWLRSTYSGAFYVAGHRFEKSETDQIQIDNGQFTRDEAAQIYSLLNSKNPLNQINALLAILERSGTLLWVLMIAAFLLLALVIIRVGR